jgi:hypothetical protein
LQLPTAFPRNSESEMIGNVDFGSISNSSSAQTGYEDLQIFP